jgi:hypothetical protein
LYRLHFAGLRASAPHAPDRSVCSHRPGCIARHLLVEQGVVSVLVGRSLLPKATEKDRKDSIEFNFEVDSGAPILTRRESGSGPSTDSHPGPTEVVLLIAKTLDKRNLPAPFSMLAPSAMLAPPMTPLITRSRKNSQVALHGHIHEPVLVLDNGPKKKRPLSQPIDCSAQQTGKPLVGSRAEDWTVSNRTIGIDMLCDSSMASPTHPRMVLYTPVLLSPPTVGGSRR